MDVFILVRSVMFQQSLGLMGPAAAMEFPGVLPQLGSYVDSDGR